MGKSQTDVLSMSITRDDPTSPRLFLLVIAATVFVTTLTASMINVILPAMRTEFAASVADIGWMITAFSLAYAVGVPLYGRMSDLFGIRSIFILGLYGFAIGGLIAALAPNLLIAIVGRFLQGAGGAAVPALSSIAVVKVLPSGERGSALGLVASSVGTGSAVGPIVGGIMGQFLGWRVLFLVSMLLMLLMIPLARRVLPSAASEAGGQFDLLGGVLLGLAAGLFLFSMSQSQVAGFSAISSWGSFLASILAVSGFFWRINHAESPFVSPVLFHNRPYIMAAAVGFFAAFANLAAYVVIPLLLVEVEGLKPVTVGLVLMPGAIAMATFSIIAGRMSDSQGVRKPIILGLLIMILSLTIISTFAGASPWFIVLGVAGLGTGFAFIQSPVNNAAANALPDMAVGAGMGLFTSVFFLGGGTGPALTGAFLAARQETGDIAINPFHAYTAEAAPFSDAFLIGIIALVFALVATSGLKRRIT